MKKNFLLIGALATLFSCQEMQDSLGELNSVSFLSEINGTTRVTGEMFDSGDEISVEATSNSSSSTLKATYSYSDQVFSSTEPIIKTSEDELLTFSAAYPKQDDISSDFLFSVLTDQSVAGSYEASDLLIATTEATAELQPTLSFNHKLSSLLFEIKLTDGTAVTVDEATISAKNTVNCNIFADSYSGEGETTSITAATTTSGGYAVILAPQIIEAGVKFVTIIYEGESYTATLESSVELRSAYMYTATFTIDPDRETFTVDSFTSGDINGWIDGGELEPQSDPEPDPDPEPEPEPDDSDIPSEITGGGDPASYSPLIDYINRSKSPEFVLGAAINAQDYYGGGDMTNLVNENYDEVVATFHMKHAYVVGDDGTLNFTKTDNFIAAAKNAGKSVFGHTLCWHVSQNVTYLDGLINNYSAAPRRIDEEEVWEEHVIDGSCDAQDSQETFKAYKKILNGEEGPSYKIEDGNTYYSVTNDLDPEGSYASRVQFYVYLTDGLAELGDEFKVSFKIRSGSGTTVPKIILQGENYTWLSDIEPYSFATTTEWETVTFTISITPNLVGAERVVLSIGNAYDTFDFDDVSALKLISGGTSEDLDYGGIYDEIITDALEEWIKGMLEHTKDDIRVWDVVNEPLNDQNVYTLKTDDGETGNWNFYWQDYMGAYYARDAIKFARQYGGEDIILFVNDYGLSWSHTDKCQALIDWCEVWESDGVTRIDGIGSQMHISYYEDPAEQAIEEASVVSMLEKMAGTGKLVKISELDMQYTDASGTTLQASELTDEQHLEMAQYYEFIVSKYFEIVPEGQRYSITHWTPIDPTTDLSWRPGEPVGLWTSNYERKQAYSGFAEGLKRSGL